VCSNLSVFAQSTMRVKQYCFWIFGWWYVDGWERKNARV